MQEVGEGGAAEESGAHTTHTHSSHTLKVIAVSMMQRCPRRGNVISVEGKRHDSYAETSCNEDTSSCSSLVESDGTSPRWLSDGGRGQEVDNTSGFQINNRRRGLCLLSVSRSRSHMKLPAVNPRGDGCSKEDEDVSLSSSSNNILTLRLQGSEKGSRRSQTSSSSGGTNKPPSPPGGASVWASSPHGPDKMAADEQGDAPFVANRIHF